MPPKKKSPETEEKPKTKEKPSYCRKTIAAQTAALINKQVEDPCAVQVGKDFLNTFVIRRPTGLTSLDLACGGGFPVGGVTQIIGPDSVGKDYLVNLLFSSIQRLYGEEATIAACMFEIPYDKRYGKLCGFRVAYSDEELSYLEKAHKERGNADLTPEQIAWFKDEIGTFHHILRPTPEEALKIVCDMVASNVYQAIVLNSIGSFLPEKEGKKEFGDERKVAVDASLLTAFMKRLWMILNTRESYGRPNTTAIIAINQFRDNIKAGLYGDPLAQGGGNAVKHGKLLDIHLSRGAGILLRPGDKYDHMANPQVGKETHWKIAKAKAGAHEGPRGTFKFYFGEHGYGFGADLYTDLVHIAEQHGILERNGAWFSYQGERLGQGATAAGAVIAEKNLFDTLRDEVFRAANVVFLSKEPF